MTRNELEKSVEYLKTLENVWTIAICHGKWDLAIFVGAKKIEDVHKVWDEFLSHYKHKVENYNFSLYSPIYNFNRTFFFEDEKVTKEKILRIYGESKIVKVDETDWRIITTYAPNVKQSILELSRKLHLSTETIKKRIKKMRKNGIICGYKIGLDVNKLGYTSYRIDLDLISTARNKELLNFCATHKGIYQINKTIGGADFEIEIIVRDLNELLDVIETIKTDFKDVVNNATYFSYSTYYLLNYIPD
jgi:Lrp/AsnC family leucine-responsive transcriptional regulator